MVTELPEFDRDDRGKGAFSQYRYALVPNNAKVRMRLAGSNPHQDELRALLASGDSSFETAISRRTQEEDGRDDPIQVRLFTGSRVSAPVGWVPRGLESIVDEALSRLDIAGKKPRIPVEIVSVRGSLRVELLMGLVR
ncbi:MAG: hypothetical protein ACKVOG_01935 [Rhodoglobus sp.]